MARYYWIKLKSNFFDLDAIDWLISQPNGCEYVVLYQKLCLLSANKGGKLFSEIGEMIIPYDAAKISRETKFSVDTVMIALELYRKLGLIYEQENGVFFIPYVEDIVGSESESAERMRKLRQGKKPYENDMLQSDAQCAHNVTEDIDIKSIENRDKDIDIDIDKEEDYNNARARAEPPSPDRCPYQQIKELYNEMCKGIFPEIRDITGKRQKAVKARWTANPSLDTFKQLFDICINSEFLKGKNNRNWKADFDFMMRADKFDRILEGAYNDNSDIAKQNAPESHASYDLSEIDERTRRKYQNL